MSLNPRVVSELKSSLSGTNAQVVTPGDADYETLIGRWSDAAVKSAV